MRNPLLCVNAHKLPLLFSCIIRLATPTQAFSIEPCEPDKILYTVECAFYNRYEFRLGNLRCLQNDFYRFPFKSFNLVIVFGKQTLCWITFERIRCEDLKHIEG